MVEVSTETSEVVVTVVIETLVVVNGACVSRTIFVFVLGANFRY